MNVLQECIIRNLATDEHNFDLDFKLNSINVDDIKKYLAEIKPFLIDNNYVENLHNNVWQFTQKGKEMYFNKNYFT